MGGYILKFNRQLLNVILLLFSLLFYLWGGGGTIIILLISIIINYFSALLIDKYKSKNILVVSVVLNLAILIWYKYINFIIDNVLNLFGIITKQTYSAPFKVILPIGISFFTFQALAYVIDVYRGNVKCQKNIMKVALYISFFPQLIAGPIVRYSHIENEIDNRKENLHDMYQGFCRFSFGLVKKVLVADILALSVDKIFALELSNLTGALAWSGVILYTLQIYFDFSAYSDMAIGMARIFGFHFQENFKLPYTAKSVTEFWKRWHISLSSFFMDYVYIPLGGNRKGNFNTYRNLAIVFILCGIWHGANWTFFFWGLYQGILLIIERILRNKYNFKPRGIWGNCITLFLTAIGWLFFRSDNMQIAFDWIQVMFGKNTTIGFQYYTYSSYVWKQILITGLFAAIVSVFPFTRIRGKLKDSIFYGIVAAICLIVSVIYMSDATFNAFIYFKF